MKEKRPIPLENEQIEKNLLNARETFIKVFNECNPFRNLGYTTKQETHAKPVINLLEEEVDKKTKTPSFEWESKDKVYFLKLSSFITGFHLYGERSTIKEKGILYAIYDQKPPLFTYASDQIINISLLKSNQLIGDLDFLFHEVFREDYHNYHIAPPKRQTLLARIKNICATTEVYEAAWIDEKNKQEFVVQRRESLINGGNNYINVFKRLKAIQDIQNEWYVPFGEKPISDETKYRKVLAEQKQKNRIVMGQLVPEFNSIG